MNSKSWSPSIKNTDVNYDSKVNSLQLDSHEFKQDYKEVDYNSIIKIIDVNKNGEINEKLKNTGATMVVGFTSIISGALKIIENVEDGLNWCSGILESGIYRLFGKDDYAEMIEQKTMNEIAFDSVGALNKMIYENTVFGQNINNRSVIKYDSEIANSIQNVSKEAIIMVGATAATVATGGAAAPLFAAGFAIGAGDSAEKKFQDNENRSFWHDSADIAIDGGIKGISTLATGKMGATAVNGIKTLSSLGVSGTKQLVKGTITSFNKNALKFTLKYGGTKIAKNAAIKTFTDEDFWTDTGAIILNDVKSGITTGEWDVKNILLKTGSSYVTNYFGNIVGEISENVINFNKKISFIQDIYFDSSIKASDQYEMFFRYFREHGDGHVTSVADYAEYLASKLNKKSINVDETVWGALCHDLGMDGGFANISGKLVNIDTLELSDFSNDYISKILKQHPEINPSDLNAVKSLAIADTVRDNHAFNSALKVLSDGKDIIPEGIDQSTIALLTISHSKSKSGIKNFDSIIEWGDCIDKLETASKELGLNFDADAMRNLINDPESFKKLQLEALIIRDSDAMADVVKVGNGTLMQNNTISKITNNAPKYTGDYVPSLQEELDYIDDLILNMDGTPKLDTNGKPLRVENDFSKKTHAGEMNTSFKSIINDNLEYSATISVIDQTSTPNCNMHAIEERLGEIVTYTNCNSREVIIDLSDISKDSALGKFYEDTLKDIKSKFINKYGLDINTSSKQLNFIDNCINIRWKD